MGRLLASAACAVFSIAPFSPIAAQTITLKCTYLIDHVDRGRNTPEHNWITINPTSDFGVVSWIDRQNKEISVRALQFITLESYKLNHVEVGAYGWTRTWKVDRSTGKFVKTAEFTDNRFKQSPVVDSGKCQKVSQKRNLF